MTTSAKEVALTYEALYEILRREKSREELQELSPGFFQDVLNYLKEKQQIIDDTANKTDTFSLDEHEKTQLQLVNTKKLVRELYDRREKKILDMALNKSRTRSNLIDTTNLLGQEKYLFESIVSVLGSFRKKVLQRVLNLQPAEEAAQETTPREPQKSPEPASASKHVKFIKPVEQFVGEEGELYGPFQPEDKAELPRVIADILIKKGDATETQH